MIDDIFCRIIGHRRSRSRAERVDGIWRSRCKRCGVPLVRVHRSKWREQAKVDVLALRRELLRYLDQRYRAHVAPSAPPISEVANGQVAETP